MAARKQRMHPDEVRRRIQTSQLINRLMAHVNSPVPLMDGSQVTAATKLLNKVLPDLSAVSLAGDANNPIQLVNRIERVTIDADRQDTSDTDAEGVPTAH